MLGQKLKQLRESKGLVLRQVAAVLNVDTAYVCKMEKNDKPVSRQHLKKLSTLLGVPEEDLVTLWLAHKILTVIENEPFNKRALKLALNELQND